jgi:hypothetical protein
MPPAVAVALPLPLPLPAGDAPVARNANEEIVMPGRVRGDAVPGMVGAPGAVRMGVVSVGIAAVGVATVGPAGATATGAWVGVVTGAGADAALFDELVVPSGLWLACPGGVPPCPGGVRL